MQVNVKHEKTKVQSFCEIGEGQVFIYDNEVWMKVICIENEEIGETNVVRLSNGDLEYFGPYENIILPKVAELNVEY